MALFLLPLLAAALSVAPEPEPRISSIHPLSGAPGQTYSAVIRGTHLTGAKALYFGERGIQGRILKLETPQLLHVEITIGADALPGARTFRVITGDGLTNEISLRVAPHRVIPESTDLLTELPVIVSGRIAERGEIDEFWIDADAGRTLTFEAIAGHAGLDPSISLYERAPSWLDPNRMERIAFNDEPLFFPGLSTDARLVHTFAKSGRYCLRIGSFSGQGSPDSVYELRVTPGLTPEPVLHPKRTRRSWEERLFTRGLDSSWVAELAARGGLEPDLKAIEIHRVEGRIASPAEAHRTKLKIERPENIAIEIETPAATMPRFNPVVLLMEPGGSEIATNVYTKLNNNGLYMMKMIQAKTTVSLEAPGEYTLEIRDITTDCSGPDFEYRVLVRRQIPHVGKIEVTEDRLNLRPGITKAVNVVFDREENFSGVLALSIEGLPAHVTAVAGAPNPIEKPPLPNGGKLERYTPRTQNSALLLTTAPDAELSQSPVTVKLIATPVTGQKLGKPIVVKELPLMILERKPS